MWSYFGAKTNIIDHYPGPRHDKIIEPFAGTARYALKYFDREVLLVDKYEVIVKIWKWLQQCSIGDIVGLPNLKKGEEVKALNLTDVEKMFLGMLAGVASVSPRNKVSYFAAEKNGRGNQLKLIASQLFKIRHWEIVHGDYRDIPNQLATWFIDAPYQFGGGAYVHNKIDFTQLASWAMERQGQAIVCENMKADWMNFKPMIKFRGAMSTTIEAIWCSHPTAFDNEQLNLFESNQNQ